MWFFSQKFLGKECFLQVPKLQFNLAVTSEIKKVNLQSFWDKLTQQFRNILTHLEEKLRKWRAVFTDIANIDRFI